MTTEYNVSLGVLPYRTVGDLADACGFDTPHFQHVPEWFSRGARPTSASATVHLAHFGRPTPAHEVERWTRENGFRHAGLWELLALAKAHPNLQRTCPIVALGDLGGDGTRLPILIGDFNVRAFLVAKPLDPWSAGYRFALVAA